MYLFSIIAVFCLITCTAITAEEYPGRATPDTLESSVISDSNSSPYPINPTVVRSENTSAAHSKYTISELVELALKRSELTASLQARLDESQFAAMQAGVWQNPILGFSSGQKEERSSEGPLYDVSITQPFFFPGKRRLRTEIGELGAKIAEVQYTEAEIFIVQDVIRLAYQYMISLRKEALIKERQKRFELIQSYLRGRLFPSPQQKVERGIVETRLNNLMADAIEVRASLQVAYEKLNLYVPLPAQSLLDIEAPWPKAASKLEQTEWLAAAMGRNLGLISQRQRLSASQKEMDLAKKEAWPDFSLSLFYGQERGVETERVAGLGISLPLPIFNRNQNGIKSAEKRIEAEQRLLRFNEQELKSSLGRFFAEYELARQTALRYSASMLMDVEKQMKEADEEFQKGRLTLITFLELDSESYETYFRSLDSQYAMVDKFLTLLSLTGERDILSRLISQ